ncbi:MAG: DNA polymerase I [Bacteroidales bacterium]|nr:DNA polymerase I [Bacteroidales bacterium]
MPTQKKLFLLDAMALIYRAFYAFNKNPRITSNGLNTSAILGFGNTLLDVIRNEKPTHIGVAFDTKAPTVRHDDFAAYKAHREAMPEELSASIPYIITMIEAFNIPVIYLDGYEADDVIGTLARQAPEKGFITYMMTSDKDFGQLVNEHVFIFKPPRGGGKAEVMGVAEVCEKFGITHPFQVQDILGLQGDVSDNIPGIPGVGEVTARKLIQQFGSVENMIAQKSKIENVKLRQKVEEHAQQALACKQLATIITNVPVDFDEDALILKQPDFVKLRKLFDELEFKTFANRVADVYSATKERAPLPKSIQGDLFGDEGYETQASSLQNIHTNPHEYILVDTDEKLNAMMEEFSSASVLAFDTETTGLDTINDDIVGISFSAREGKAYYIPLKGRDELSLNTLHRIQPLLTNPNILKSGQNLKFDISVLQSHGITVNGPLFDTMIAHYLVEPDQRHNLDFLSEAYLKYKPVAITELIGKKSSNQLTMDQVDVEQVKEYAAEDADLAFRLMKVFEPVLKENSLTDLFEKIEMPLIPVLADMEATGVKVNKEILNTFSAELQSEIKKAEYEIYVQAGESFNISSPKQLGIILFEKLKIDDKPKKTRTKQYSTGEEILEKLLHKHPIVPMILEYRSLTKLKSTYVDALPALINSSTGRIHTSYNQAVASTGRLSSNNPNLQNIPIRTERGREIRKAFIPADENHILLAADYSQIELRIIAHLSQDVSMMQAFWDGTDIHTATAARVYGLDLDKVDKEQRRFAKSVNFGIIYGISAFGLAENLSISRREAASIIESYFKQYPGVKAYMDETIVRARKMGYAETIVGRKRQLRDIHSANATVRGFSERNAINAPIQGSSADMIKIAMINIHKTIKESNLKSKMIMQVHDELVFEVYKPELEQMKEIVRNGMVNALPLSVPVVVDMNTGADWLEAH